jgi:hypothetical protein
VTRAAVIPQLVRLSDRFLEDVYRRVKVASQLGYGKKPETPPGPRGVGMRGAFLSAGMLRFLMMCSLPVWSGLSGVGYRSRILAEITDYLAADDIC